MKSRRVLLFSCVLIGSIVTANFTKKLEYIYADENSIDNIGQTENTETVKEESEDEEKIEDILNKVKEIVHDVDPTNKTSIIAAGFEEIDINIDNLVPGDIMVDSERKIYAYITDSLVYVPDEGMVELIPDEENEFYRFKKLVPVFTIPSDIKGEIHTLLDNIELPSGFYWEDNVTLSELGKYLFKVKFVPENDIKYETVHGIDIEVEIIKRKIIALDTPVLEEIIYNPLITLEDIPLPAGWTWLDPSIIPQASRNQYPAIFTPVDTDICDYSGVSLENDVILHVNKAKPDYFDKLDVFAVVNQTLSDIELPKSETGTYSWNDASILLDETGLHEHYLKYVPDDENYEVTENIPVRIMVCEYEVEIPRDLTAKYGDKLSNVELPEGFSWLNKDQYVGVPGKYEYDAVYMINDCSLDLKLELLVVKGNAPVIIYPTTLTHAWQEGITTELFKLPNNWFFTITTELDAGVNRVTIYYEPADKELYDYSNVELEREISITITKAIPPYEVPGTIFLKAGEVLDDSMLPDSEIGVYIWNSQGAISGTYTCSFVPYDLVHYRTVTDIPVKVVVEQTEFETQETESSYIEDETFETEQVEEETKEPEISNEETESMEPEIKETEMIETETESETQTETESSELKDYGKDDIKIEETESEAETDKDDQRPNQNMIRPSGNSSVQSITEEQAESKTEKETETNEETETLETQNEEVYDSMGSDNIQIEEDSSEKSIGFVLMLAAIFVMIIGITAVVMVQKRRKSDVYGVEDEE